ncbi:hydrogen peroxide-inducible genes activator [Caulobacter sp. AP07]|uniref:hydrogen peroxide-inducible genes activator n=1 Tax=Caulobacter sp. AP07 TaxID=1144304 RepID=UPI00054D7BE3|nr:hydrogen peroxide-inducible genes activator [Caulobacter sp. AP07]
MLPTLRQLQYLKLLSEHGSFSRAAEACHVTQPTLSAGIQELEKILGAPVVDRARSGVILTAAGQEAVRRAEAILAQAEDLVQAARGAGQPLAGRFRLGVIPTVAPYLLPRALPVLRDRFPKLRLYLREDLTHRLIASLKSGALDAALIALPYDMTGLDWAHVEDDELLAAAPANHRMAAFERVDPESLRGDDMILLEDGHCLRDHALAACGLEPPPRHGGMGIGEEESFAATSLPTLVQMIGSGLGVSFLPSMAVAAGLTQNAPVTIRPLDSAHSSREIVVAWRNGSSRSAEGRLLAQTLRDLPPAALSSRH